MLNTIYATSLRSFDIMYCRTMTSINHIGNSNIIGMVLSTGTGYRNLNRVLFRFSFNLQEFCLLELTLDEVKISGYANS